MSSLTQNETFGEAFELTTLAKAINKIPYQEGLLGRLIDWEVEEVWTEEIRINSVGGSVQLVPKLDRDGVPPKRHGDKRSGFPVMIPGYAERAGILNRALLGVSAGLQGEAALETVAAYILQMGAKINADLDLTVEHQRAHALSGDYVDADGVNFANIYDIMGVDQIELDLDLNSGTETLGDQLTEIVEIGETALGGSSADGWMFIASATTDQAHPVSASSKIMRNKDYKDAYNSPIAVRDRQYDGRKGTNINGLVDIHHYRRNDFLPVNKGFLVPVGPGLAKSALGPSDVDDYLGSILPRYPLATSMRGKRGRELEIWTFIFNFFTRPEAVIQVNLV